MDAAIVLATNELEVGANGLPGQANTFFGAHRADANELRGEFRAVAHQRKDRNELPLVQLPRLHRPDERGGGRLAELLVALGVELAANALAGLVASDSPVLLTRNFDFLPRN